MRAVQLQNQHNNQDRAWRQKWTKEHWDALFAEEKAPYKEKAAALKLSYPA